MRERMMNWRSRQVKTIIFSVILLVSLFLWNGVRYHDTKTKSLQGDTREEDEVLCPSAIATIPCHATTTAILLASFSCRFVVICSPLTEYTTV